MNTVTCFLSATNVMEVWNHYSQLTSVRRLTDLRKKKIHQRLRDKFWSANFEEAIAKCADSDFCCGKNDRGWKADIDWFLRPDTVVKILEGKYDNRNKLAMRERSQSCL